MKKAKKGDEKGRLRRFLGGKTGYGPVDFGRQAVNLAQRRPRLGARIVLPPLIAALLVALGMAALRIDLLRLRYAVAATTLEQQSLLDESRSLTARMRKLRDPVDLAMKAGKLGFERPDRLIDMSGTAPGPARQSDGAAPARMAAHQRPQVPSLP